MLAWELYVNTTLNYFTSRLYKKRHSEYTLCNASKISAISLNKTFYWNLQADLNNGSWTTGLAIVTLSYYAQYLETSEMLIKYQIEMNICGSYFSLKYHALKYHRIKIHQLDIFYSFIEILVNEIIAMPIPIWGNYNNYFYIIIIKKPMIYHFPKSRYCSTTFTFKKFLPLFWTIYLLIQIL